MSYYSELKLNVVTKQKNLGEICDALMENVRIAQYLDVSCEDLSGHRILVRLGEFDYFSKGDLAQMAAVSNDFPDAYFIVTERTETDDYREYEVANGRVRRRKIEVVLEPKEWEELILVDVMER